MKWGFLLLSISIMGGQLYAQTPPPAETSAPPTPALTYEGATPITPDTERDRLNQQRAEKKKKSDAVTRVAQKAQKTLEINSLYYYETGYARFYQGFFANKKTLALNDQRFTLHDWTLSFASIKEGAYRTPRFAIESLDVVALTLSFYEAETKLLDCHLDFYQHLRPTPCDIPATLNPSLLRVHIEALTQEGIAYHLDVGLSHGLNETYAGSFSLDQLTDMKLSHYPYRVGLINDQNWFTFIAPMNDRFQVVLTFKDQKILINVAGHEPVPNYAYLPPIKEEAPVFPAGYPYRVQVYSPRKTFDLSIRIFVEAGVKFLSANEATVKNANMFPLAEIRLSTLAVDFPYLVGFFAFEQSLQNVLSDSQLSNLSGYDLQARLQYQFRALWSRPVVYTGVGLFELNAQDQAFQGAFLPRISGAGIAAGVDAHVFGKIHLRPGFFFPFLLDQVTVSQYLRPELGVAYAFTDHLSMEARWKGGFYTRTPAGASTRSGTLHHWGMFFSYNL